MTNCPKLLLPPAPAPSCAVRLWLSAVLDTDKHACMHCGVAYIRMRRRWRHGMPAEQPTTTTSMYAPASPLHQQCIHPGQCEGQRWPSTSFVHGRACPAGLDMRMSPHKHTGRTHRVHAHTLAAGSARDEVGLKYGTCCTKYRRLSSSGPSESGARTHGSYNSRHDCIFSAASDWEHNGDRPDQ
jgi:hypothetical protein